MSHRGCEYVRSRTREAFSDRSSPPPVTSSDESSSEGGGSLKRKLALHSKKLASVTRNSPDPPKAVLTAAHAEEKVAGSGADEERQKVALLLERMRVEVELLEKGNRELELAASALEQPKQVDPSAPQARANLDADSPVSPITSAPTSPRSHTSDDSGSPRDRRRRHLITDRYDVDPVEIAATAHGQVTVARQRGSFGRKVAIKTLVVDTEIRKLDVFKRELVTMQEMDHPNICKLLDTYDEGRRIHVVTELLEGGSLQQCITNNTRLEERRVVEIVQQVASALRFAHTHGITHRDLKPENVMLCKDGTATTVKVVDWGVSSYFDTARSNSTANRFLCVAPEVLEGVVKVSDTNSSLSDVWSLGVMAYVMLCGKAPFTGRGARILSEMKFGKIPMKDSPWDVITPQAKAFLVGTLQHDPMLRMSVEDVVNHDWLMDSTKTGLTNVITTEEVLRNLATFSYTSLFISVCLGALTRQLGDVTLQHLGDAFAGLDLDNDGVVTIDDVRSCFERVFGRQSDELQDVEDIFLGLELGKEAALSYTEFCTPGRGIDMVVKELFPAAKLFGLEGANRVMRAEFSEALQSATGHHPATETICEDAMRDLVAAYNTDQRRRIRPEEWCLIMREKLGEVKVRIWEMSDMQTEEEMPASVKEFSLNKPAWSCGTSSTCSSPRPDVTPEAHGRRTSGCRQRLSLLHDQGLHFQSPRSRHVKAKTSPSPEPAPSRKDGYGRSCCGGPDWGESEDENEDSCSIL